MKVKPWQTIHTSKELRASIFQVEKATSRSLSSGRIHDFDILVCPNWVNVVALTPGNRVVLVKQFRHGTQEVTIEIPGGQIEAGESPLEAAKRELAEETGFGSDNWILLGVVQPNPAFQTNKTYTYLALQAENKHPPAPDENEEIELLEENLSTVAAWIRDGTINHALVLCGFFFLIMDSGSGLEHHFSNLSSSTASQNTE